MDGLKEQTKSASDILEGTWEYIITDPQGKKKSHEVTIDKAGKYYIDKKCVYDSNSQFVEGKAQSEENIIIHKTDKMNKANQIIERIDYKSEDDRYLSGTDDKKNSIEYKKL